ncbi:MAG: DUF438 domain-containing protein [Candidatus Bathyarchaeota archaeon]|nr:DUF438 domain-containing protein [Candidatus Bathyarchaeota archaeon]
MDLKPETKLKDLVDKYPFLIEFIPTLSPHYERLKNPVLRETMFKIATLEKVAQSGGFTVEELAKKIKEEIDRHSKDDVAEQRKEILKSIIRDLHDGVEMEVLRKRFADLVKDVSATEIAEIEQSLIDEGLPETEVKRLCDVHVEVFKHALDDQDVPRPPAGHPVHTFMVENRAAENIMGEIDGLISEIGTPADHEKLDAYRDQLSSLLEKISEIEKHYLRKENQLFPHLEAHGVSGPSQVMWALHDDVREVIKIARRQVKDPDPRIVTTMDELITTIKDMIYKEEHILFPMSLETLTDKEWLDVKNGSEEIGYAWTEPMVDWTPDVHEEQEKVIGAAVMSTVALDTGALTPEQVNLMLTHLPVDVTFVDENDRVAYYSSGKERIFPRSPGIIGREVIRCHPPRSVHVVENIVKAFKDGTKDEAEFWLQMGERFIHIRYFPIRDKEGNYRGTIEVSQDVTEIRKLEGQRRLLDWTQ